MKIGADNPKKVAVAVCLLLAGVFVLVRGLSSIGGGTGAAASSAPPVVQNLPPGKGQTQILPENNLDPRLRLDLLQAAEKIQYQGNGRNIFRVGSEPVKVIPKPVTSPLQTAANTPPPPPRISLKFFGFANGTGGGSKVFLAKGDDVFVAGEGEIVDRRYKILRITPTSVEVEDVVSNIRQTLLLTQG